MDKIKSPPEIAENVREVLELTEGFTGEFPVDSEIKQEDLQGTIGHLRTNFPHLDDTTLAAFAGYIACNVGAAWVKAGDEAEKVLLGLAVIYSHVTEKLAESLPAAE